MSVQIGELRHEKIHGVDSIAKLLNEFNGVFLPTINSRVSIREFAKKLHDNGCVFAVKKSEYLGFIAFYCNDKATETSFISLIGVHQWAQGQSIGELLLHLCYEESLDSHMKHVKLEVQRINIIALKFYEKNGFRVIDDSKSESIFMKRDLKEIE